MDTYHEKIDVEQVQPISRTYQYRKVMKPMLERKRRARINRCLDELKDLMSATLQNEGENVSKLEKADILELTVKHLRKIHSVKNGSEEKFRAGYTQCANELSRCLARTGVDVRLGTKIMCHLGYRLNDMDGYSQETNRPSPASSPYYSMPPTPTSTRCSDSPLSDYSANFHISDSPVWRPW